MVEISSFEDRFLEYSYHEGFDNCILEGLDIIVERNYNITIYPGIARLQGKFYLNSKRMPIQLPKPEHGLSRKDRITLKLDTENQTIRINILHGTESELTPNFHAKGKILFLALIKIDINGTTIILEE